MPLRSFAASLGLHAFVFWFFVLAPAAQREPESKKSLYAQVFAPHEKTLIWDRFRDKLPEVSPLERKGVSRTPRADVASRQTIVARPERAQRSKQMIWLPAPQVKIEQDLQSPNLLAFEAPAIPAPPRTRPKLFVPPAPPRPEPGKPQMPAAPELRATQSFETPLRAMPKAPPKPFVPPPSKPQERATVTMPAAPELVASATPASNPFALPAKPAPRAFTPPAARPIEKPAALTLPSGPEIASAASFDQAAPFALPAKLPPRAFTPPTRAARAARSVTLAAAAPDIGGAGSLAGAPALPLPGKPAPRMFVPPAATRAFASGSTISTEDAPAVTSGASLTAAVVGLNPTLRDPVIPDGGRPAKLNTGPKPTAGGSGEPVEGARVFVPGLMVRGNRPPAPESVLVARAIIPTSREMLLSAARLPPPPRPPMPAPGSILQTGVAPDPRFEGRVVYQVAIQAANVTSFSGSWIVWFAERQPSSGQAGLMQAPAPRRKVDPTYHPGAAGERVEGAVRMAAIIRADGQVESIELLKGVDFRLDRSALVALSKWQFEPARVGSTPVDVEAIFEVPFRLAPLARK
jgi:TonB family protein